VATRRTIWFVTKTLHIIYYCEKTRNHYSLHRTMKKEDSLEENHHFTLVSNQLERQLIMVNHRVHVANYQRNLSLEEIALFFYFFFRRPPNIKNSTLDRISIPIMSQKHVEFLGGRRLNVLLYLVFELPTEEHKALYPQEPYAASWTVLCCPILPPSAVIACTLATVAPSSRRDADADAVSPTRPADGAPSTTPRASE